MSIKPIHHKRILILADIEGSSACNDYESTKFLGKGWPKACRGMTRDVNAVVEALFNGGVEKIIVKDFHRTGYNLFQSGIDKRATLISGYRMGQTGLAWAKRRINA
ncbi:MAG: M55 family metallopeptidase [Pseudomonadota bacterium]